jgi:DNA-binding NarL/FixJ family response regulator
MDILILTSTRLFGDCLERCLQGDGEINVVSVVGDLASLRDTLERLTVDLVLVDITQGIRCDEIQVLADDHPGVLLLALGLAEQESEVIACGAAGFSGYIPRDAPLSALRSRLLDANRGAQRCPENISASLLRALFRRPADGEHGPANESGRPAFVLSPREGVVARLVQKGYSNKEIARELNLSVATVKHHVHSILEKLQLPGRVHIVRKGTDESWLMATDLQPLSRAKKSSRCA